MTTIVARDGVIAGDGVVTDEDMIVSRNFQKVWRLRDGRVVGMCGDLEAMHIMLQALKKNQTVPKLDTRLGGLMYDTNKKLWLYEGTVWRRVPDKFYAIGSGSYFAMAAMKAGADAVKACKIGADMDTGSGGRIRSYRVGKLPSR